MHFTAATVFQKGERTVQSHRRCCYCLHKLAYISDSQKSHTPVKIQRLTHTSDDKKLIINDITKISVPDQTEYSFQYSEGTVATSPILSVSQILDSSSNWDKVTICGKIVHMCDQELAGWNKLRLARATFADTIGTIAIDLWEENIAVIKIRTVYRIAPIQVRVWNEAKKLSTIRSPVVTPVTDTQSLSFKFQKNRWSLRWPTTVTAKQRKRVGQRLLFATKMVCRVTVTVTHCSLEKSPFFEFAHRALWFELTMFCSACGSVVDEDTNYCKSCGRGTFLNLKYSYLHFF